MRLSLVYLIILFILTFYWRSDLLYYIVCLLVPAYLTYKSLDKVYPEVIRINLLHYWIAFGLFSFPLDWCLDFLIKNEIMKNLLKIIFFSSLYHPKSNTYQFFHRLFELVFVKNQIYFKAYMQSFLDGFDGDDKKKNKI